MTTQQALEQVKQIKAKYQLFYGTQDVETQALTVAIECMEAVNTPIIPFLSLCGQGKEVGITIESTVADVLSKLTRHQSDTETGI